MSLEELPSVALLIAHYGSLLSILPAYDLVKHGQTASVLLSGSHMTHTVIIAVIHARGIATVLRVHASIVLLHCQALSVHSLTIERAEAVLTLLQGLLNVEGKC